MIKKLKYKFIRITMLSLFLVLLVLVGLINSIVFYTTDKRADGTLQLLSDNRGKFPEMEKEKKPPKEPGKEFKINPETKFQTRYFIIEYNEDGSANRIDTSHISAITSDDALDYAEEAMHKGRSSGYEDIYKYKIIDLSEGTMVIFMDCRNDLEMVFYFFLISCGVALGTLILVFFLVNILSIRAINPIIESIEKQRQFITDAGHELKTPLAIISANADVLELTTGESEWINSIRNQTIRLDKLVKNLLTLSKVDEGNIQLKFAEFDLSACVSDIAGSFTAMAETQNKKLVLVIQPGLLLQGEEGCIQQLVSTLLDNAMKYSNENGEIKLTLSGVKKGIRLELYNTIDKIETKNLDRLFDRFYRDDASRSRETGGYGIGLSIAKSIVEAHHGKISVKSEDGKSICFTISI